MSNVFGIVSGPWHSSEVPNWDELDDGYGLPYGEGWVVVSQVEDENGRLKVEELIFETLDDAMELVDWFKSQTAPYIWEDEDND